MVADSAKYLQWKKCAGGLNSFKHPLNLWYKRASFSSKGPMKTESAFDTYISQSWRDHGTQTEKIAKGFREAFGLIEKNDQIPQLANLILHVTGQHLGDWQQGIALLESLKKHKFFSRGSESEKAIQRSIATLHVASGNPDFSKTFSRSDQVRVLSTAASALSERNPKEAQKLFLQSVSVAEVGLDKSDPANRSLAVTGNNLACSLEEKEHLSKEDIELMIMSATLARRFWEIAGKWIEIERAEYRLAKSYLRAKNPTQSREHALNCLKIANENEAAPLELFYGTEALALAEKAAGNKVGFENAWVQAQSYFNELKSEDKARCKATLENLKK